MWPVSPAAKLEDAGYLGQRCSLQKGCCGRPCSSISALLAPPSLIRSGPSFHSIPPYELSLSLALLPALQGWLNTRQGLQTFNEQPEHSCGNTCHTPPWPAAWKAPCVDLEWQELQLLDVL